MGTSTTNTLALPKGLPLSLGVENCLSAMLRASEGVSPLFSFLICCYRLSLSFIPPLTPLLPQTVIFFIHPPFTHHLTSRISVTTSQQSPRTSLRTYINPLNNNSTEPRHTWWSLSLYGLPPCTFPWACAKYDIRMPLLV